MYQRRYLTLYVFYLLLLTDQIQAYYFELLQVKKLGEGNYATVEQCVLHGKSVAVKRLKPEMIQNVVEVNGFIKEGGVIARLNNP